MPHKFRLFWAALFLATTILAVGPTLGSPTKRWSGPNSFNATEVDDLKKFLDDKNFEEAMKKYFKGEGENGLYDPGLPKWVIYFDSAGNVKEGMVYGEKNWSCLLSCFNDYVNPAPGEKPRKVERFLPGENYIWTFVFWEFPKSSEPPAASIAKTLTLTTELEVPGIAPKGSSQTVKSSTVTVVATTVQKTPDQINLPEVTLRVDILAESLGYVGDFVTGIGDWLGTKVPLTPSKSEASSEPMAINFSPLIEGGTFYGGAVGIKLKSNSWNRLVLSRKRASDDKSSETPSGLLSNKVATTIRSSVHSVGTNFINGESGRFSFGVAGGAVFGAPKETKENVAGVRGNSFLVIQYHPCRELKPPAAGIARKHALGAVLGLSTDLNEAIAGGVWSPPLFAPIELLAAAHLAYVDVDPDPLNSRKNWKGPHFFAGLAVPLW